ncbi:MAG TPA: hypothetical protein VK024_03225, partial [Actinomycetaceae bacterium]|nr:hypothetical protein [Actinomycetaceae bacterium]
PRLFTVVWVVLLSAFLWSAASRSIARVHARRKVADLDLRTLAAPALALPAEASLDAAPSGRDHVVLLNSAGEPVMIVDPDARAAVPPQARATTPLGAVAVAIPTEAVITELHGADGVAAAAHAARFTPTIVLREHGRIIGVLSVNRLEQALAGRSRSRGRGAGPRA